MGSEATDWVVHVPERSHRCGPRLSGIWLEHIYDVPGTVRECACGRTWVACVGGRGWAVVLWYREGWWARRRRLRLERMGSQTTRSLTMDRRDG